MKIPITELAKLCSPLPWHLEVSEDSNADGLKENVAVIYDGKNCGEEIFRTPTHSTRPEPDKVDEDAMNHAKFTLHCTANFLSVLEALREAKSSLLYLKSTPHTHDDVKKLSDAALSRISNVLANAETVTIES